MDAKPFKIILEFIDDVLNEYVFNDNIDCLEAVFMETIFDNEYLNLNEFILYHIKEVSYSGYEGVTKQFAEIEEGLRDKLIEVIYNIIYYSQMEERIKIKLAKSCARYGILFDDSSGYKEIIVASNEKCIEGSFAKVFLLDDDLVKKQLKYENWENKDICSRFKAEYEIQDKLYKEGLSVLEVFDYNSITHSFLMKRADEDLEDYLKHNILTRELKIDLIMQILNVMKRSHELNIIHRDLHCGNILMLNEICYIGDFGFAKDASHVRSKLSTFSPKNNHLFLAPEGFRDFTLLDEKSDIFSLGRLVDYIMGNGNLGIKHELKLLVERCTKSDKQDRYDSVISLEEAFDELINVINEDTNFSDMSTSIGEGKHTVAVEEYIVKLADNNILASQVVANKWIKLASVFIECELENQNKIIKNLSNTYIEATGYGKWENYDIFGKIAYDIVNSEVGIDIRKNAYDILEDCSNRRFKIRDLSNTIPDKTILLMKSKDKYEEIIHENTINVC
ncbi:MAG: protein kinase [Eubacteriales bacterium]